MGPSHRRGSLVAQIRRAGGIVLVFVSTKGGAGKSTSAWNVAHEMAQRGARVLLIDTDTQQTLMDAAAVRRIPARVTVRAYPHVSIWEDLPTLRAGYDVVVIDSYGRHGQITRAVTAAAARDPHGVVVVPVSASGGGIWAVRRDTVPILAAVEDAAPWVMRKRVLMTQFDTREVITAATERALTKADIAPLTATGLSRRADYANAMTEGQAVCEYAPHGTAAAEVAAVTTELVKLALTDPRPRQR